MSSVTRPQERHETGIALSEQRGPEICVGGRSEQRGSHRLLSSGPEVHAIGVWVWEQRGPAVCVGGCSERRGSHRLPSSGPEVHAVGACHLNE